MASLSLDTYKAISLLQEQGFSKKQAEGFVAVLHNADLADVATSGDIISLKETIVTLERAIQAARVEMYKVAAAQTLVMIGAIVALMQAL